MLWIIYYLLEKSLNYKRRTCLTRVNSCWNYDQLLAFWVAQSSYRYGSALVALPESLYLNFGLKVRKQVIEFIGPVRKGVSEFNRWKLVRFEKIRKLQAKTATLLLILAVSFIADLKPSPSPFVRLFIITITQLHTLIIKTALLRKPFNLKAGLSLHPLHCEVEPNVWAARVGLLV